MTYKGTKLAFVSNTSWSVYNFRIDVIRSLISLGCEVYVLAPKDEYSAKLISEGANFLPIKLNNYSINPWSDLVLFHQLIKIYRQQAFTYIFHYTIKPNIYGSIAAKISGCPSTAITTGLGRLFSFRNRIIHAIALTLYRLACKCSNEVWFLNSHDKRVFIEKNLVQPHKTFILPSEGINTTKFHSQPKQKTSLITRFLFAGRLLKSKGIYEFVEAARVMRKTNRKLRFEVLGFIDEKNPNSITIRELTSWQKKGWIKYLGSTEDVRRFIARCDCIVFPSFYSEGISRILLEAASMEKTIVTTTTVGCTEVVEDGRSGFLCSPRSVSSLVSGLQKFLALSPAERILFGQNGRKLVKHNYSVDRIVNIYQQKLNHYYKLQQLQPPGTAENEVFTKNLN